MGKRTALKQFRIGVHKKQGEMSEILGVSRQTYVSVENGIRNPKPKFWIDLQAKFNIPDEKMFSLQKTDEMDDVHEKY